MQDPDQHVGLENHHSVMNNDKFVEGCEALAHQLESATRVDLAALCDRAAYWLDGGAGVEDMSINEIIESCRDTLTKVMLQEKSLDGFVARTTGEILSNIQEIESAVVTASKQETTPDRIFDRAAKLQALSILSAGLFK